MLILKKINTPHIISNLYYTTTHNAFYKDMYTSFGLTEALVHPELYEKLLQLEPKLKELKLKLVIYDAFRPLEVQKFMYETAPEYLRPYIAPPPQADSKRGFHPRGVAIDCYLTTLDNKELVKADNGNYLKRNYYNVTLIHPDPVNTIQDTIMEIPYTRFTSFYSSEDLNHYRYEIYY